MDVRERHARDRENLDEDIGDDSRGHGFQGSRGHRQSWRRAYLDDGGDYLLAQDDAGIIHGSENEIDITQKDDKAGSLVVDLVLFVLMPFSWLVSAVSILSDTFSNMITKEVVDEKFRNEFRATDGLENLLLRIEAEGEVLPYRWYRRAGLQAHGR